MPQEDIGSVLERFHKWAGHQAKPVRELSYEEAVARSRHRFYDEEESAGPQPIQAAAAPVPAPPPPIPFPLVKEPPAKEPPAKPSRPASAKSAKTGAPAGPAKKAASRKKASQEAKPRVTQKKSAKKSTARAGKTKAPKASKEVNVQPSPERSQQNAAPAAAMGSSNTATAASAYAEARHTADTPEARSLPEATFAQVLAAQIELPEGKPAGTSPTQASEPAGLPAARPAPAATKIFAVAPLPDDAPAVHLTVRLASNERESMRERARDLGITPSAYVRQCALEVDSLRTELDHARLDQAQVAAQLALAQAEARSAKSDAALCLSARTARRRGKESEWFKRLRNFVFPRKAKGQAFATHA